MEYYVLSDQDGYFVTAGTPPEDCEVIAKGDYSFCRSVLTEMMDEDVSDPIYLEDDRSWYY